MSLSIVVPMFNEEDSVLPMVARVHQALTDFHEAWELVLVDDGSSDRTLERIDQASAQYGAHVRAVELQRNYGQTAAMQAGIDVSRGDLIVTLDGDLQNDPVDIPRMVAELRERDLDLLQGWRQKRHDHIARKIPSRIANRLIASVTGVKLHDYGCSLKVYRAAVLKQIRLYGEMHRFIPVWVASVTKPSRIGETRVTHHAREFGQSKYGLSRTFRVILDLLAVFFFLKYRARPGHFFGYFGLLLGTVGGLIMSWLAAVKFVLGEDIGSRPLFFIGILLMIASLQFITTGVLAEMLSRVFFQATNSREYALRQRIAVDAQAGWHHPQHDHESGREVTLETSRHSGVS